MIPEIYSAYKSAVFPSRIKQQLQSFASHFPYRIRDASQSYSVDRLPRSHVRTLRRGRGVLLRKFISEM